MMRPRPMTMRWSAVSAISLIRCEEMNTVLPCCRLMAGQIADPQHALGVQPVDRLVQDQGLRVPKQRDGDAQALAHAQREAADLLGGDGAEPGELDDLVHPLDGNRVGCRQGPQVGACAAGTCAPTWPPAGRRLRAAAPRVWHTCARSRSRCPKVGRSRPTIMRMVVDFPAPFGPRNPVTLPGWTVKPTPSTARLVP